MCCAWPGCWRIPSPSTRWARDAAPSRGRFAAHAASILPLSSCEVLVEGGVEEIEGSEQTGTPLVPPVQATGDAYVQLGYGSLLRPDDAFPKARASAERALQLDSTLAEPHATLGFVRFHYDWDWPGAEGEFRKAISLDASSATAHEWYGLFLAVMGRFAWTAPSPSVASTFAASTRRAAGPPAPSPSIPPTARSATGYPTIAAVGHIEGSRLRPDLGSG